MLSETFRDCPTLKTVAQNGVWKNLGLHIVEATVGVDDPENVGRINGLGKDDEEGALMSSCETLLTSLDDVVLPEKMPPIVLIAFARPDLLEVTLESIRKQSLLPPKIVAYIDGPRKPEDDVSIGQCVALLEDFNKFVPVEIVKRQHNLGCDRNVILGLTEVLSTHDSLVYIEDDIEVSPCFYDRMCRLLEAYRECTEVASVSAYSCTPPKFEISENADFFVSNRVFSWGMALWADRWDSNLFEYCLNQYNPFGEFYEVPVTSQTKMTAVNQFWLEKNKKTDWVIAFTLASLYQKRVHIVPNFSFTRNIGFGHPESETYKGKEEDWVNARYRQDFVPSRLPLSLEVPPSIARPLDATEMLQHLIDSRGIWLSPSAFLYFFKQSKSLSSKLLATRLFVTRLSVVLRRLRSGLSI